MAAITPVVYLPHSGSWLPRRVRPLPRPVPACSARQLWQLPPGSAGAAWAQLAGELR